MQRAGEVAGAGVLVALCALTPRLSIGGLVLWWAIAFGVGVAVLGRRASLARHAGGSVFGAGAATIAIGGAAAVVSFVVTSLMWRAWGPTYEGVSGPVGLDALVGWAANSGFVAGAIGLLLPGSTE